MHPKTQSQRRHHRERIVSKRLGHWSWTRKSAREKGILTKTPTPCSCWMCGNPRRHTGKPTLQEAKHNQTAIEQADEDPSLPSIHNIGPTHSHW